MLKNCFIWPHKVEHLRWQRAARSRTTRRRAHVHGDRAEEAARGSRLAKQETLEYRLGGGRKRASILAVQRPRQRRHRFQVRAALNSRSMFAPRAAARAQKEAEQMAAKKDKRWKIWESGPTWPYRQTNVFAIEITAKKVEKSASFRPVIKSSKSTLFVCQKAALK